MTEETVSSVAIEQEAQKGTDKSECISQSEDGEKPKNLDQEKSETAIITRKELPSPSDRQRRFYEDGISLEETHTTSDEARGIVKVRNIVYQKTVFARVTFDYWESWKDVQANHLQCLPAETADLFIFNINWHTNNHNMEFAVCCQQHGMDFWANNNRLNFLLIRPQAPEPKETLEIAKLELKVLPVIEEGGKLPIEANVVIVKAPQIPASDYIKEVADHHNEAQINISPYLKTHLANDIPPVVNAKDQLLDIATTSKEAEKAGMKMSDVVEQIVEKTEESKPKDKKRKRKGIRAAFRKVIKFFRSKK